MKIKTIFAEQFAPIKLRGKQPDTFRLYRSTIKLFGDFLGRDAELADFNDLTVAKFLLWYEARPRVKSPKSVNNRRQHIQTLWTWAAKKGLTPTFPDIERLPEPEFVPKAWTMLELQQLMRAIDTEPGIKQVGRHPGWLYWRTIHLWWYYAGERSGATLAVEWAMVDWESCQVHVPARIRKGKVKPKTYTLPQSVMDLLGLMRRLDPEGTLIFGGFSLHLTTWYNRYSWILQKAGLPDNRMTKGHKMRKTHGSHLKRAGGDPQKSLGHSRSETTARYLDPDITDPEQVPACALLPEL